MGYDLSIGSSHFAVTYNYCDHFLMLFGEKGIRTVYGKTGAESIPILQEAIKKLRGTPSKDYWASTSGNVKKALKEMLSLSKQYPNSIWEGD